MLLHLTLRHHYLLTLVLLAGALLALLLIIALVIAMQDYMAPMASTFTPDAMFPGH
jgi:hypothetical protein